MGRSERAGGVVEAEWQGDETMPVDKGTRSGPQGGLISNQRSWKPHKRKKKSRGDTGTGANKNRVEVWCGVLCKVLSSKYGMGGCKASERDEKE